MSNHRPCISAIVVTKLAAHGSRTRGFNREAALERKVMQAAALDRIIDSAQFRFDHVNNGANFGGARVAFAGAVEQLVGDFGSQGLLMEWVADLIDSFLNAPTVNSNSLINVLLLGNPGVGKTRLATTVAGVLGKLGLFVYDSVTVCGRSDFVAEFEGQVAAARGI